MTIYMKVSGIDGDVSAKGHEQWIQCESFHVNARRKLNTQPGRTVDKEGSRPTISEVTVTKRMDQASPKLFQESVVGAAHPTVQIDMTTASDSTASFMQYTLSNAIVSSYQVQDSTVDGDQFKRHKRAPVETLTLNFDKIEMRYVPRDANNKPASPMTAAYDLKQASAG